MTARDVELAIERLAGAYRQHRPDGVRADPAFHDLDAAGRAEAYARALELRRLEAATDPDGRSGTVRAVLARIARAG